MIVKEVNGMKVMLLPTTQFKVVQISLGFLNEFQEDTINMRALLPRVLVSATKKYPTPEAMEKRLNFLYGTELSPIIQRYGMTHWMGFRLEVLNHAYINQGDALMEAAIQLLSEVVFQPKRYRDRLKKSIVLEEIRQKQEELEQVFHDKTYYGFLQFKNLMFQEERYRFNPNGLLETLQDVNEINLTEYYHQVLSEDAKIMTIAGNFVVEEMLELIEKYFHFTPATHTRSWLDTETKFVKETNHKKEFAQVNQAKLFLGYRVPVLYGNRFHYAMSVFNLLFGGYDQSLLFDEIREQLQLCYSISSSYHDNKGLIYVMVGVEPGKERFTEAVVEEILKFIQKGLFSDALLKTAKTEAIRQVRKLKDSLSAQVGTHLFFYEALHKPFQMEQAIQQVEAVTREEIIHVASLLVLDTIYAYTQKGDQDD